MFARDQRRELDRAFQELTDSLPHLRHVAIER